MYKLKLEEQFWEGLTAEGLDEKVQELKDIGIKKFFIVESDEPQKTESFADKEKRAREAFTKAISTAKRKTEAEYQVAFKEAWSQYEKEKNEALAEIKA